MVAQGRSGGQSANVLVSRCFGTVQAFEIINAGQLANVCVTECMKTQQCAPAKHHYDECAERVTHQQETNGKAEEDCVEECKCRDTERMQKQGANTS